MAPDIVDTIRDLFERLTSLPGPVPRVISRQEWQDMAFPSRVDNLGLCAGVIESVAAFGSGELIAWTEDGGLTWRHDNPNGWSAPHPDRDKRAKELLLSLLDDKQRAMYEEYQCFVAVGSKTGDHYLIYSSPSYNVYNISTGWRYCAVSSNGVPFCDMLASQLLMIECEEEAFWGVANRGSYYAPESFLGASSILPWHLSQELIADAPKREAQEPEPTVTRAPRIGNEPRLYFTDGGRYRWGLGVMQGYGGGIREPPIPIQVSVSGYLTPDASQFLNDMQRMGCLADYVTEHIAGLPTFEAELIARNGAELDRIRRMWIGRAQDIHVRQQFPEDEGWVDCTDPDCPSCREYRRQERPGQERHQLRMEELIAIASDADAPDEARRQAADELRRM